MATATQVPVEIYLDTMFEPDAEYVDGYIEERPMGQYDHASWQQAIQLWFAQFSREWNIRVRPGLRVKTTPTNFRVADVVVFDRDNPIEQVLHLPPIAVFEVMSPEDRVSRMVKKLKEYEAMGIPNVMLIEPATNQISQYRNGDFVDVTGTVQQLSGTPLLHRLEKGRRVTRLGRLRREITNARRIRRTPSHTARRCRPV